MHAKYSNKQWLNVGANPLMCERAYWLRGARPLLWFMCFKCFARVHPRASRATYLMKNCSTWKIYLPRASVFKGHLTNCTAYFLFIFGWIHLVSPQNCIINLPIAVFSEWVGGEKFVKLSRVVKKLMDWNFNIVLNAASCLHRFTLHASFFFLPCDEKYFLLYFPFQDVELKTSRVWMIKEDCELA